MWSLREGYNTEEVKQLGIEYINYPVSLNLCPANDVKMVLTHIEVLIQQGKYPIYIHCKEGVDRTGFVIAAYRVMVDGWDVNEAIEKWKEEKTEEGKVIRSKAPLIWESCFKKNFSTMDKIQILEISPPVIETKEQTYPVTLTLKGKGFSQVNEIILSWRGHDSGQRVWRKGDQNWINSLKIESDEKMSLKIYVLWNEPPTEKIKEWDWTVTLKNSQGESVSGKFTVKYLPSDGAIATNAILNLNSLGLREGRKLVYLKTIKKGNNPTESHLYTLKSSRSGPCWDLKENEICISWINSYSGGLIIGEDVHGIYSRRRSSEEKTYLIKYPLKIGTYWYSKKETSLASPLSYNKDVVLKNTIEALNDVVTVPAGTFRNCIKIKGEGILETGQLFGGPVSIEVEVYTWYAPGFYVIKGIHRERIKRGELGWLTGPEYPSIEIIYELESFEN